MVKDKEHNEIEEPPGQRWQLSHRLNTVEELSQVIHLTPQETAGLSATGRFRVDITPHFASLMDPDDPNCPILRQVIPTAVVRNFEGFISAYTQPEVYRRHDP